MGSLVQLIQQSSKVSDAVIIPITAFGFGKAVPRPKGTERHESAGLDRGALRRRTDLALKEGETPQPYNLDTLFLWSLLMGLEQEGGRGDRKLNALCRLLRDDLEAGRALVRADQGWGVAGADGVKNEAMARG